jgi:predicted anti-sigma-YlaC factor YlaD
MRCDRSRELISALLDGEGEHPDGPDELREHLARCPDCRSWAARAESLHRSLRLRPAPDVPDLTEAILRRSTLERDARPARRRPGPLTVLRVALCLIALTQVLVALPELLTRTAGHGYADRHLGGWDLAFALGLAVVVLQPWRARGLLPMAAAVAGVMAATLVGDAVSGGVSGMAAGAHVLEIAGLALLWAISRVEAADGGRTGGRRWPQWSARRPWMTASSAPSSRMTASRARATRDRTVPTGQSQTDAVSA